MKKTKIILISLLSLILIFSPLIFAVSVILAMPPVFEDSFVGVLDDKLRRLDEIEESKIIVIGGSSVAFGVNSPLIEEYVGMPVVNFGLYASLGTKLMLDLSEDSVKEGDIVILAPEMDSDTLSLFFNGDSTLRALDGSYELLSRIKFDDYFKLLASSFDFAANKIKYKDTPIEKTDVYHASSFNEYLDIEYPREYNIMHAYHDANFKITLDESIVSREFIDYLNDYIAHCERRGAKVYFSWCPMNSLAVTNESEDSIKAFSKFMEENINADFISDISNYILPPEYFYDTNFHVNDSGMIRHSVNLCEDILFELDINKLVEAPEGQEIPGLITVPKPTLPFADVRYFDRDENDVYFTYEKFVDGSYVITGLSELGKNMTSLTVPFGYNEFKVSCIAEGAFDGTELTELIIPEDTNLKMLLNGCFKGAGKLSKLVIYHKNAADIIPPADFIGVSGDFVVYVPENSNYEVSGYYWSERNLTFERIEK